VKNAQIVLLCMGSLFAVIFFGISFLSGHMGIVPDPTENRDSEQPAQPDAHRHRAVLLHTAIQHRRPAHPGGEHRVQRFPTAGQHLAQDKSCLTNSSSAVTGWRSRPASSSCRGVALL